jgi:hypothetical protein
MSTQQALFFNRNESLIATQAPMGQDESLARLSIQFALSNDKENVSPHEMSGSRLPKASKKLHYKLQRQ